MNKTLKYDDLVIKYLILSLPVLLISGPLLPEIAVGVIFFLIINKIIKNKIEFFDKTFTYLFLFFCANLVIGSILSEHLLFSLKPSLFYIRFFILILAIYYILNNSKIFLNC